MTSYLPIERQTRAIGATWLDQQLIGGGQPPSVEGFGGEVKQALSARIDYLIEQGLAVQRGQRVVLARHLWVTLCDRELATVAQDITTDTGLVHRPVIDGQRVTGFIAVA